ncbi:unnamed protein product [Parnassius apollo]|uniref:(apollo) hypothetical protein n=1 Tax=Parnassius apollo TaxID=110799 RepID=A0A8S3X9E6_PARAO|nr:unnamed protein product [Parnassius apollo]
MYVLKRFAQVKKKLFEDDEISENDNIEDTSNKNIVKINKKLLSVKERPRKYPSLSENDCLLIPLNMPRSWIQCKKKYKKALKVSEIVDYLQDIEDYSDEELNDIEVAILPPDEVDEMTDIEEGHDYDMGVFPVSDVAGQVEFSCTIDNVAENLLVLS